MRILLLGKSGQVGWELQRSLSLLGEVVAVDRSLPDGCDLDQPDRIDAVVDRVRPDAIVNAAAYTAVDKAEVDAAGAERVNAIASGRLAEAASRLGAWLVNFSTDYVFDGSGDRPWRETDTPAPLNVYGATKLEGERRIAAAHRKHVILRTSWVYAARGGNFARTMLRLARERELMTVVDDQVGAPTSAELLADATAHVLKRLDADPAGASLAGTYHLTASGAVSWHGYAAHVLEAARRIRPDLSFAVRELRAVPSTSYPVPARRPLNSRLDTRKFREAFGLELPDWRLGVDRMLTEILQGSSV